MSGPQFLHIQSYSRKANKIGQSVQQILDEAGRAPEFCQHVENPEPPNLIYGLTPQQVREKHDAIVESGYVEVALKDGTSARRGIRKDRHTLLTAVASYPFLTKQVAAESAGREDYARWIDLNVRWLKETFGDRLISVVEHVDEEHPHIHAFILPFDDPSCSARHLNPAWKAKEEAEATARESGKSAKEAVKLGNLAYRARGRDLQDQYFAEVGLPAGLTRVGPKRERLSREQWKQRKEQARRDAAQIRQMTERVKQIADIEAQLDADADRRAEEIAKKLDAAEALFAEALSVQSHAEEEAQEIRERANGDVAVMKQEAQAKLDTKTKRLERRAAEIQSAHSTLEQERHEIMKNTVLHVAAITARVLVGVLTGSVRFDGKQSKLCFEDPELAHEVEQFEIAPIIQNAVIVVSRVWSRLAQLLSSEEIKSEHDKQSRALSSVARPVSKGIEP
ncbi:plasmid recombination protein [Shimia thalassica]|uniref:plasmid recombination protein n=1 Tax=Shimia thalassica TaxID=1715693 RepID=UPI0024955357|nr:plasmid recombination protein [Shimia thalassica]